MIAGISGHQSLGDPEAIGWVENQLSGLVTKLGVDCGLTSLAAGADQLYANVLLGSRVPYVVIVPCRRYEETFAEHELSSYLFLRSKANQTIELDFENPSEEAFYAAGKQVVERSDILIAVWDGLPAQGLGGTADIVGFARARCETVIHVNHITREVNQIRGA